MKLQELRSAWSRFLEQRAPRERLALQLAAWLLLLFALWSIAVAPAWRTLRQAPGQQARLQPQLHAMRAMAAEAQALRQNSAQPQIAPAERQRALDASTQRLLKDSAQVVAAGDQFNVTLRDAEPQALAQWLQELRINAGLRPSSVQLERGDGARWKGLLVLAGAGATP